jgi:hypothetical protein
MKVQWRTEVRFNLISVEDEGNLQAQTMGLMIP